MHRLGGEYQVAIAISPKLIPTITQPLPRSFPLGSYAGPSTCAGGPGNGARVLQVYVHTTCQSSEAEWQVCQRLIKTYTTLGLRYQIRRIFLSIFSHPYLLATYQRAINWPPLPTDLATNIELARLEALFPPEVDSGNSLVRKYHENRYV